jgi:hypothetical protein
VQGDVNVPAGHVTFAFDASSRSLQGAGQPLQLPSGVHSRVDLAKPGVRQLIVQVRWTAGFCVLACDVHMHCQPPSMHA